MTEHVAFNCQCNRRGCMFCDGGLFRCINCDSFEGATTSECPGKRMTQLEIDKVYKGELDFKNGEWVNEISPNSPEFYRKRN